MWGCTGNAFHALFYASQWRKASQCKILIKDLKSSVKVQRRRRECMVRQSRADIAELLHGGRLPEALNRAEQMFVDENWLCAYDQIECFCTCILQNYSRFQHQSDVHLLPDEIKEAISGLIFAASRIGELLELQPIRNLFRQRFGSVFDRDCVELSPGNVVGSAIKRILLAKTTVSRDATTELLMGIALKDQTKTSEAPPDSVVVSTTHGEGDADQKMEKTETVKKLKTMVLRFSEKRKKMVVMPKKENSQHVHPNLPVYEDFEATLEGLRKEQRRKDLQRL